MRVDPFAGKQAIFVPIGVVVVLLGAVVVLLVSLWLGLILIAVPAIAAS